MHIISTYQQFGLSILLLSSCSEAIEIKSRHLKQISTVMGKGNVSNEGMVTVLPVQPNTERLSVQLRVHLFYQFNKAYNIQYIYIFICIYIP